MSGPAGRHGSGAHRARRFAERIGTSATIQWSQNVGALESAQIELSRDGGVTYEVILAHTPSDGSRNVAVQAGWATSQRRLRITWLNGGAVSDISNNNLRIH